MRVPSFEVTTRVLWAESTFNSMRSLRFPAAGPSGLSRRRTRRAEIDQARRGARFFRRPARFPTLCLHARAHVLERQDGSDLHAAELSPGEPGGDLERVVHGVGFDEVEPAE